MKLDKYLENEHFALIYNTLNDCSEDQIDFQKLFNHFTFLLLKINKVSHIVNVEKIATLIDNQLSIYGEVAQSLILHLLSQEIKPSKTHDTLCIYLNNKAHEIENSIFNYHNEFIDFCLEYEIITYKNKTYTCETQKAKLKLIDSYIDEYEQLINSSFDQTLISFYKKLLNFFNTEKKLSINNLKEPLPSINSLKCKLKENDIIEDFDAIRKLEILLYEKGWLDKDGKLQPKDKKDLRKNDLVKITMIMYNQGYFKKYNKNIKLNNIVNFMACRYQVMPIDKAWAKCSNLSISDLKKEYIWLPDFIKDKETYKQPLDI